MYTAVIQQSWTNINNYREKRRKNKIPSKNGTRPERERETERDIEREESMKDSTIKYIVWVFSLSWNSVNFVYILHTQTMHTSCKSYWFLGVQFDIQRKNCLKDEKKGKKKEKKTRIEFGFIDARFFWKENSVTLHFMYFSLSNSFQCFFLSLSFFSYCLIFL